MKKQRQVFQAVSLALLGLYGLTPSPVRAIDIVSFSSSDVGSIHAVGEWGTDFGNLQIDSSTMGSSLATYGTDFDMSQPLNANGTLSTTAMSEIASQAATIAASGLKLSVFMGPTVGNTDASYEYATYGNVNVTQWAAAVTAYKNYWQSLGYTVSDVTPFNEPDYWSGQGSSAQLAQVMQLLRDDPTWKGTKLQGAATLNAGNAQTWYTPLVGIADAGSSHLLGGSLSNYDTFAQSVVASGAPFAAPELHKPGRGDRHRQLQRVGGGLVARPPHGSGDVQPGVVGQAAGVLGQL